MKTYYTKCGRKFEKSSTATVTGYSLPEGDRQCEECPFRVEVKEGWPPVFKKWECRAGSLPPNQKNDWRGSLEDKNTIHIHSLHNDFLEAVMTYCKTAEDLGAGFNSDIEDCRRTISVNCSGNKKGIAAKRKLIEKFFPETTVQEDAECNYCEDCKYSVDEGESVEFIKCSDKKRFVQKRQKACDKFEPWEKHHCIECLYCRRSEKSTDHPAPYKCFRAAHRDGQGWYFPADSIACINFKPSAVTCITCKTDRATCGSMYPSDYMYKDMKPCSNYTSPMTQMKYVDDKNRLIFVNAGLGGDDYMTMYRDQSWRDKGYGMHRLKSQSLPVRDNPDEAQADLDAYAAKKDWKEYIEETKEADEVHIDNSQKCEFNDEQCPYYCSHNTGCSLRLSTGNAVKSMLDKMTEYNCDTYHEMKQKYLLKETAAELVEVTSCNQEELTQVAAFDYSTVDKDTANFLQEKEQKITQIRMMSVMAIGKELKEVHEKLANNKTGTFGKWCESIGMSRRSAENYIQALDYIAKNFRNIEDADQIQPSLLFAISKPSAPAELQKAVLDGDITTHKQYKELEDKLKAERERADSAERREKAREQEKAWEEKKARDNYLVAQKAEERADKAEKALQQLTKAHAVSPGEAAKLHKELAEAKRQVEILTDELMKPVEVAPAIVEKIPEETERELANLRKQTSQENDYMFVYDILNMLRITHHAKLRNWAKVIAKENTETKVREIRNELIDFGTIFESMIDYLDEEIQKK